MHSGKNQPYHIPWLSNKTLKNHFHDICVQRSGVMRFVDYQSNPLFTAVRSEIIPFKSNLEAIKHNQDTFRTIKQRRIKENYKLIAKKIINSNISAHLNRTVGREPP